MSNEHERNMVQLIRKSIAEPLGGAVDRFVDDHTVTAPRDGIPITPADLANLDRWSREPGHEDTLAGYIPKLLDEIDRLNAERRPLRTIQELTALPHRSIILDKDDVTYRLAPWGLKVSTWYPLDGWDAFHRDFGVYVDDIALPATLLHEGTP